MDYTDQYLEESRKEKEKEKISSTIKGQWGIDGNFYPYTTTGTQTTSIPYPNTEL